ncbi:helix-turn-helix transcriptional regulator [Brevundimonas sp.]|uniref:helix-turn-helix transcriptional regulator n=1 Tax=Brevundimonas sp. TaxID=1871086 RepID=UPI002737FEF6|nr:helix-turn-helix transcriptional regulator [Brevundimonas sp.]MDP3801543.1 helix-turn-helix transcriptional regulator [Brevundimonas sp.]
MLAQRAFSPATRRGTNVGRYFEHRAATGRAMEMIVGAELELLWTSAAALALASRRGPIRLGEDRLVLPQRRQEDSLRAFLARLGETCGVWTLEAGGRWLVRVEPIAPVDAPPGWMLTWQAMDQVDRYLWADIGESLRLTPSEIRILRSLLDGQSIEQTASRFAVSVQTARTHVRRIYAKLGVNNREQLFAAALPYRWG